MGIVLPLMLIISNAYFRIPSKIMACILENHYQNMPKAVLLLNAQFLLNLLLFNSMMKVRILLEPCHLILKEVSTDLLHLQSLLAIIGLKELGTSFLFKISSLSYYLCYMNPRIIFLPNLVNFEYINQNISFAYINFYCLDQCRMRIQKLSFVSLIFSVEFVFIYSYFN